MLHRYNITLGWCHYPLRDSYSPQKSNKVSSVKMVSLNSHNTTSLSYSRSFALSNLNALRTDPSIANMNSFNPNYDPVSFGCHNASVSASIYANYNTVIDLVSATWWLIWRCNVCERVPSGYDLGQGRNLRYTSEAWWHERGYVSRLLRLRHGYSPALLLVRLIN